MILHLSGFSSKGVLETGHGAAEPPTFQAPRKRFSKYSITMHKIKLRRARRQISSSIRTELEYMDFGFNVKILGLPRSSQNIA